MFYAGDLATEVRARGLVAAISPSPVRRILKAAVVNTLAVQVLDLRA